MTTRELATYLNSLPDMPVMTIDTCYCCTEEHDLTKEDITRLPKGYRHWNGERAKPLKAPVILIGASSMYSDTED